MNPMPRTLSARPRRRIALLLVLAIVFAGFAQAAHFHQDELAGHKSQADTHCLLCLFAAGTAGPPTIVARVATPAPRYARAVFFSQRPRHRAAAAPYEARAPPHT